MTGLSKSRIQGAAPDPGRDVFLWDDALKGFGVRVKPSGVKSYVVQFRTASGRSRRMTLGRVDGPLSTDQARKLARSHLAAVAMGEDPAQAKIEARQTWTVADLARDYLQAMEAGDLITRRGRPKAPSTVAIDRGRIERHIIPLLGARALTDLKRSDIRDAFMAIKAGRTAVDKPSGNKRGRITVTGGTGTAKKAIRLLSAMMSHAVDLGRIETNPVLGFRLPRDGRREVRDPAALYEALGAARRLAEAAGEDWRPIAIIRLAALTGGRKDEIVSLRWADVDLPGRVLRLSQSKTGPSNRPLGRAAVELLTEIRNRSGDGEYVFPAPRIAGKPYAGLPRAWARIGTNPELTGRYSAELSSKSMHFLRHAFATTADNLGMSIPTVAALLGQAAGGVTAGYIGRVDSVLTAAADRVTEAVTLMMREASDPEVSNARKT